MSATTRDGYDLGLIARTLERIKGGAHADGSFAIQDVGAFADLKTLIVSAVKFGQRLPEAVRRTVVSEAVHAAMRQKGITAQMLLDEVNKSVASYYKQTETKYDLVTSISASHNVRLRNIAIAGCRVRFSGGVSKQLRESRQELLEEARRSIGSELPKYYTIAKVRVVARSELEAWDRGVDALDLVRAFWNLALNRGSHWRMSFGKRKPVNRFVLGPVHTLHKTTGELATETWWYQTDYQGPLDVYGPGDDSTEKIFRYADHARERLKRSGYEDHLVACLLRYVRALDTPDWQDSYLRLWGVLEQLTNTGLSDNYKITIRRASFLWKDRDYAQQILLHLRDYRNVAVHVGTENQDIETYMYQLKRHVEALIAFHLKNRFRFQTIGEAAEFMDLPDGLNDLDRKLRILKAAKVFHGHVT